MRHFIRIITHDQPPALFVESAVHVISESLHDKTAKNQLMEGSEGNCLSIPLTRNPGEAESDYIAETIAEVMFDMGHDDFDIEVSQGPGFDAVEDCIVFMKNDPLFYRRHYFPAVLRLKGNDEKEVLKGAVDKAMQVYCKKFNLGPTDKIFKDGDRDVILDRVYEEESENVSRGEYD